MLEAELLEILKKVKSGDFSPAEAAERMERLEAGIEVLPAPAPMKEPAFDIGWWKYAWLVPVGVGTVIFVSSAFLTSWAYVNERMFWFYCSWLPLLFGLTFLLLGLWSIRARWAHIRVQEAGGKRISISTPLPLGLPSWILRTFSHRIPGLQEKNLAELPPILDALRRTNEPITVEVDDKNGDRVRVYIL
jgi:hypothetical protein